MKVYWIWECPICKNVSPKDYPASGNARRNGRGHLKEIHNDYETEPILTRVN